MKNRISFIGAGNMASSLIGGLVANGFPARDLWASDPSDTQLQRIGADFGVHTTSDNVEAIANAETVVLAVKPQHMSSVLRGIAPAAAKHRPLVISVAAGIREPDLSRWLGYDASIVRCMPNTPALVRCGATALFANAHVSAVQRNLAQSVLDAVGLTVWVDEESLLDAVTAVSGSGPAYCFLLLELMTAAGKRLGLSEETAMLLSRQTVLGAAKMAMESSDSPRVLREKVTSPGGTTERALELFAEGGIGELVTTALTGARDRAVELGDRLGAQ